MSNSSRAPRPPSPRPTTTKEAMEAVTVESEALSEAAKRSLSETKRFKRRISGSLAKPLPPPSQPDEEEKKEST